VRPALVPVALRRRPVAVLLLVVAAPCEEEGWELECRARGLLPVVAGVVGGAGVDVAGAGLTAIAGAADAVATGVVAVLATARAFLACPAGTFWVVLAAVEVALAAPFLAWPGALELPLVVLETWTALVWETPLDAGAEVETGACFLAWPGGTNVPDDADEWTEAPLAGFPFPLPTCPGGVPCGLP
jgi:hypothetical protein